MIPINVTAKCRFNSAKAQRVHLVEDHPVAADLLCLESRQELSLPDGCLLYVVAGTGSIQAGGEQVPVPAQQLMAIEGLCKLTNPSEQYLVCLAFRP